MEPNLEITECRRCARLVAWREKVRVEKVLRFSDEEYWGKPVPSFGRIDSEVLIVGLAPAAHGANRTGRMFTGDRSGEWLYRTLHQFGFCNRAISLHREDDLTLNNCRITAVAHCAPPQNRLTKDEITRCHGYLENEVTMMPNLKVIVALGQIAFTQILPFYFPSRALIRFQHGLELIAAKGTCIIASYHPSQQNTFTKRLTEDMFHGIFRRVNYHLTKRETT